MYIYIYLNIDNLIMFNNQTRIKIVSNEKSFLIAPLLLLDYS